MGYKIVCNNCNNSFISKDLPEIIKCVHCGFKMSTKGVTIKDESKIK